MIYYTVYRTTNNINNKIYVGVHKTENLEDNYLGSGTAIKRAIKKYDRHNFTKEILHIFDNEKEAYLMESNLVTLEFISESSNYNLAPGGRSSSDRTETTREKMRKPKSPQGRANIKKAAQSRRGKPSWNKGIPGPSGPDNGHSKKITIYNNNNNIMFECHGDFEKICKTHNLPHFALSSSHRNNGRRIFVSTRKCDILRYTNDGRIRFKGWYALKSN